MKKIFLSVALLATIGCSKVTTGHECPYKMCPYKGMPEYSVLSEDFLFKCECEEGSDCYYLDIIHFKNPNWTYDQCEDYLFKPNK